MRLFQQNGGCCVRKCKTQDYETITLAYFISDLLAFGHRTFISLSADLVVFAAV